MTSKKEFLVGKDEKEGEDSSRMMEWNRSVRENSLFEGGFRCFRVNVLQPVSLKEMADKNIISIGHFF
jgi:hypothetical protein